MLTQDDGVFLLKTARDAIEKTTRNEAVCRPEEYPESLDAKMGVFCTINKKNTLGNLVISLVNFVEYP